MKGSWVTAGVSLAVYLLVLGEAAHHSWVHDAVEQHGQWVDGEAPVRLVLVDHGQNLLIGGLHGLDGVLQRGQGGLHGEAASKDDRRKTRVVKLDGGSAARGESLTHVFNVSGLKPAQDPRELINGGKGGPFDPHGLKRNHKSDPHPKKKAIYQFAPTTLSLRGENQLK